MIRAHAKVIVIKKLKWVNKTKIAIKDEERLAEEVRGYRVIYMKDHDDHKYITSC